ARGPRLPPHPRCRAAGRRGYTPVAMDLTRSEPTDTRFDELHAEAAGALAYAGNTLRAVRDGSRAADLDDLAGWSELSDDLGALEHDGNQEGVVAGARPVADA